MARQIVTVIMDDLDGGDADSTVEFGLDGIAYTIDLSEKNAAKLRKALDPYLKAATRAPRGPARRTAAQSSRANGRDTNQVIREWAGKNGWDVAERGRIPSSVVDAYDRR